MKKYILSFLLCFVCFLTNSQETYNVNGTSYTLIKETNGTINLLWNEIDGVYRYFVEKDGQVTELTNKQNTDRSYNYEYRTVLEQLTADKNLSASKVRLTLMSLKSYLDKYNSLKDSNYAATQKAKLLTRMSAFGGITNSPFVQNPDNIKNPVFGVEFEFSEAVEMPKHSIYFQGRQVVSSDSFDYSATQLIVGYRFRFINKKAFNIYASVDLAQYVYTKTLVSDFFEEDVLDERIVKENGFKVPATFGIGADIRLAENSFLSITLNELFSIEGENEGNFPTSIALGYKFKL